MAFSRFTLNTSQLNDVNVGLDGSPFLMNATASAVLGSANNSATSLVSNIVSAQAVLGGVVASADATVAHTVTADAALGSGVSEASAQVAVGVVASASLGGLASTAVANVAGVVTASALLGELTSSAQATVDPAPSPPPPQYPGGNPWYRRPKVQQVEKVEEVVQVVVEPLRVPLQVFGVGSSVSSLSSSAITEVTWSILEDEAELLLLV
jgi:hypothetical protein